MIDRRLPLFALTLLVGFAAPCRAEEMRQMKPEVCQLYGQHLTELFEKEHKDLAVKFAVDSNQACGLHAGGDGIVCVPIKGIKEGEINPEVESEKGGGLCYLFMSPCYAPLVDGKAVDGKKLRKIKYTGPQGDEREVICLVVTVKHVGGDDWRLYAFGAEKSPVIDSRFSESAENVDGALAIRVNGASENKANLVLTLFKKYSAGFAIAHK